MSNNDLFQTFAGLLDDAAVFEEALAEAAFSDFCSVTSEDVAEYQSTLEVAAEPISRVEFFPGSENFTDGQALALTTDLFEVKVFRDVLRKEADSLRQKLEILVEGSEAEQLLATIQELENIESAWIDSVDTMQLLDWAVEDGLVSGEIASAIRMRVDGLMIESLFSSGGLNPDVESTEIGAALTGLISEMETNRHQQFERRRRSRSELLDILGTGTKRGTGRGLRQGERSRAESSEVQIYRLVRDLSKNQVEFEHLRQILPENLIEEIERTMAAVERRKPLVLEIEELWGALTLQLARDATTDPVGVVEANRQRMIGLVSKLRELQELPVEPPPEAERNQNLAAPVESTMGSLPSVPARIGRWHSGPGSRQKRGQQADLQLRFQLAIQAIQPRVSLLEDRLKKTAVDVSSGEVIKAEIAALNELFFRWLEAIEGKHNWNHDWRADLWRSVVRDGLYAATALEIIQAVFPGPGRSSLVVKPRDPSKPPARPNRRKPRAKKLSLRISKAVSVGKPKLKKKDRKELRARGKNEK